MYCIVVNRGRVFDEAELQALHHSTYVSVVNWYSLNNDSMRLTLFSVVNCPVQTKDQGCAVHPF